MPLVLSHSTAPVRPVPPLCTSLNSSLRSTLCKGLSPELTLLPSLDVVSPADPVSHPTANKMAQVQRRNTDIGDNVREKQERRKSGIFSFTRSFKKYASAFGYFSFQFQFSCPVAALLESPCLCLCEMPDSSSNGNMQPAEVANSHAQLLCLPQNRSAPPQS